MEEQLNQEMVEETIDDQNQSIPEEGVNSGNDSSSETISTKPTEKNNTEVQPIEIGDNNDGMSFERFTENIICRK